MPGRNVAGAAVPPDCDARLCALAGEREHGTDSISAPSATKAARSSPMVSVYDGRDCIGFVLARGKVGFEAYAAAAERSLGIYPNQREAAAAIMRRSS